MIMRIWHGWTKRGKDADAYHYLLREEFLPELHRIDGYEGAWVLRRDNPDEVEFVALTVWKSWRALEQFAGRTRSKAVIHPKATQLLTRHDAHSQHFDAVWVP